MEAVEVWGVGLRTQRVHVGIWYILRAQRGSHIPTLRPKYIPYTYNRPCEGSADREAGEESKEIVLKALPKPPKVCKMMAFRVSIMGLGLLFYIFWVV